MSTYNVDCAMDLQVWVTLTIKADSEEEAIKQAQGSGEALEAAEQAVTEGKGEWSDVEVENIEKVE